MEKTKGHICPTCAGQLKIDEERRLYLCPFCGVTFDYEYFREADVLDRGAGNLADGEFKAATEAYKFMLAKDPHNFEALKGLLFAAAGIKKLSDLMEIENVDLNYKSSDDELQLALSDASAEDRPFFESMQTILQKGSRYKDLIEENKKLSDERKFRYREIDRLTEVADHYMFHTRWDDGLASFNPETVLMITVIVWSSLSLLILSKTRVALWGLIFSGVSFIPAAVISVICILKLRKFWKIKKELAVKRNMIGNTINRQMNANEDECTKLRGEIRTLVHKIGSSYKE